VIRDIIKRVRANLVIIGFELNDYVFILWHLHSELVIAPTHHRQPANSLLEKAALPRPYIEGRVSNKALLCQSGIKLWSHLDLES
jgi:hypothetical protein